MSYNLIKKINNQLIKEVPLVNFPFQYGTVGSLLSGLLIPVYGTEAIEFIQNDFSPDELNVDIGNMNKIEAYVQSFNDELLSKVAPQIFQYIKKDFFGNLRNFFHGEVWQIDSNMVQILDGYEEIRDSILLFVFSAPIFPISEVIQEVMINFHIFEPDESYTEIQSILSDFFNETPNCQRSYLAWKYLDSLNDPECDLILEKLEAHVPFICDGCGTDIKGMKAPFITRVEVYPSRHLNFDQNDFEDRNFEKEITDILETAGQRSEKELTKEMWTEHRLFLCHSCRNTFVKRIEDGEFI